MRITEVYPYQPGATADYQLRGGTGHHDSFVELYTSEPTSLAGYRITVGDCEIVCPRDSYIWNFKVIWLSDMVAVSGGRCKQFPTSGIVHLYDPRGTLIDTRAYSQPQVGEAWAPLDALDPDSSWDSRVPSPGRNRREGDQIPASRDHQRALPTKRLTGKSSPTAFLSYAREDQDSARRLTDDLRRAGITVWLDQDSLLPGQDWRVAVDNAIRSHRFFIALLSSRSISKKGYVQKELRIALEVLDQYPESQVFIIPVRLDECAPSHHRLNDLQRADLFPDWAAGLNSILKALQGMV